MSNYALTLGARPLQEVEDPLRQYLPGIDARLWPCSASQAIITAPLVSALEAQHPNDAGSLLRQFGVTRIQPITDQETRHLPRARDAAELPARPARAA